MKRLVRPELAAGGRRPGWWDERGASQRTLLLVLLLIVIAAAATFLLFPGLLSPPEAPAPPPAAEVTRKTVKIAPKPAAPAGEQAKPATEQAQPAAEQAQPVTGTAATPPPAVPEPEAAPAPATAVAPRQVSPKPAPAPRAVTAVAGPYTLQAGAFALDSSLEAARKKVRELGYTPRTSAGHKRVEMIRLKVGAFDEAQARARVAELQRGVAPDAFVAYEDPEWVVYAGSYVSLDRARSYADRLYLQGLRTSEVRSVVELPLTILRFGDFADKAAAEAARARAVAAGLDPLVVKLR